MQIKYFKSINSTNTYALDNFDELSDFTAISADEQTQGRGRFERKWKSDSAENLYLSFVLKPEKKTFLANLTQYLAVVLTKIFANYGVYATIKWPNDVLVGGKKISGILCEAKTVKNQIVGVVLGVGINLNMSKDDIALIDKPATSLNLEIGKNIDKQEFLLCLIDEFKKEYLNVIENGFSCLKKDYMNCIEFLGNEVFIQQRDGAVREKYLVKDVDENGSLIVLDKSGVEKKIFSGDLMF